MTLGEAGALAVPTIIVVRMLWIWIGRIGALTTWDYGPAQLAIHSDMVRHGMPLYRDFRVAPFLPLVYGPLVPALVARLALLFGDGPHAALEAGRALTIVATFISAAMIFFLARRMKVSIAAAILAGLAFMLSPIVLRWGFAYRVDMPVLACELCGLFAFADGATAIALAFFIISFFIKQVHAVGIATAVLFCWINGGRRRALHLALIWVLAVTAGTTLLAVWYPDYLLNAFGAVRTRRLDFIAPLLFFSILIGGNLGVTLFAIIALTRKIGIDLLMLLFLIVASIHDLASCLRWGSNAYYFLPALAALAVVSSVGIDRALTRMRTMPKLPQLAGGLALAMLFSMGYFLAPRTITADVAGADPWDPRALTLLRSIDGPILTDVAELKLVDTQKNLQWIDLMVLTSMQQIGSFDDSPLVGTIERREIAAFALDDEGLARSFRGRALFWPRIRSAIEKNYEAVPTIGPPYIMVRRNRK
ncbi:MAG TPA: hypothetical protein VMT64_11600 [Candidatus Binataceae bacterium]|nr:hypothetical protein [Candidatus Binataceae bacterium]